MSFFPCPERTALGLLYRKPEIPAAWVLDVVREQTAGGGELLKAGRLGRVTGHLLPDGTEVVLKSHGRRWSPGCLPCWRIRHAWMASTVFQDAGVRCARALACLQQPGFPEGRGWLLSRRVRAEGPLHRVWTDRIARGAPAARRAFVRDLARDLAPLIAAGLYHPDLSAQNVLALPEAGPAGQQAGGWSFVFIDLDGVRPWRRLTARRLAKNLAQLAHLPLRPSAGDSMRFLRTLGLEGARLHRIWRLAARELAGRYAKAPCEGWA